MFRNKKGVTLIEIMLALVIIALIVFTFTPMIVLSFKRIYESGNGHKTLYARKGSIEKKLADRNNNTGNPSVIIETVFKETSFSGKTIPKTEPIPVSGTLVTDSGTAGDFSLATVYTSIGEGHNKARIRLAPNSVSEDDNLLGKVIYVYAEFMVFSGSHASEFKLLDNAGAQVGGVAFAYMDNTTISLTLNSSTPSLTASKSPYTVQLGNNPSYSARLYVEPPGMIAASADGNYYTSRGIEGGAQSAQAVFTKASVKIANNISDLVWDSYNSKYIAVGNSGIYRTLSGGTAWTSNDIVGDGTMLYFGGIFGLFGYRNRTPDIQAIDTDNNGSNILGGTYMLQSRILFGWSNDGIQGFLSLRNSDGNTPSSFPAHMPAESILSVNDLLTCQEGSSFYTLAAGEYSGARGYVYARSPGINNGDWFETFDFGRNLPIPTDISGGVIIDDKGTANASDDTQTPLYVFCTGNGKIYLANQIVRHASSSSTTNWQEIELVSGSPGQLSSVIIRGNKIIAAGNSNRILVGTIGTSGAVAWKTINTHVSNASFNDIAYINDRFYAVGQSSGKGIIYYSTDGEIWTQAQYNGGNPASPFIAIAGRNQ